MALTGVDPFDPTPSIRRELIFAAGLSSTGPGRSVLLWGNRTAAGSETLDTLSSTAIADDADAVARFGLRSELYAMYRDYVAIDPGATIYGLAVTESGGAAAACTLTVANIPTAASTLVVTIHGIEVNVPIAIGDAVNDIASTLADEINDADSGRLQVTANAVGAVVTVTCAQAGNRGDFIIGDAGATFGIRHRFLQTTNTTLTKGGIVSGGADDDFTTAIASASLAEHFYHVVPFSTTNGVGGGVGSTTAISATDNQIGELQNMIVTQSLPINGKSQTMVAGYSNSQAHMTSVGNALNSVYTSVFHAEHNDKTPAMLAAHHAAVVRSQQIAHPSANFAGYHSTDNTIYTVQQPFTIADRPTATEIRADLNNGGSPIEFSSTGAASLVRHITTHSEISAGIKDYRARSGHIPSAVLFAWDIVKQRWASTKQAFVAADPTEGQPPTQNTTTPLHVKALIFSVIDDLAASNPLGVYNGPILAPDKVTAMKNSVVVSKVTAGISASVDFYAVEHLYKAEYTIRETGAAY